MKKKIVHLSIIGIFCSLYFLVATISMINSVEFFDLAHSGLMSWSLAIGFELGAAASLAAIIILEKTNRAMVWGLFLLLTAFQMMGNSYHAFVNLEDYMGWIELFGLQEEDPLFQKRILSVISGAVLPVVALGFIKSLIDYIRPEKISPNENVYEDPQPPVKQPSPLEEEDYDSEGNVIIPPRIVIKEKKVIPTEVKKSFEVNDYGDDDWATPPKEEIPKVSIPIQPKHKLKAGRKIIGKKQRAKISSKPRI